MFTASNIATEQSIFSSCQEIQTFLEAEYNADNPAAVLDRANAIESYMALSGKMLADAKYHHATLMNSIFMKCLKEGHAVNMTASTLNKYIDTVCKDYQYLVDWCDRINRSCTHALEFSRTVLSKLKEEMRQSQYSR